mgnify:CR=1 FL=1
MKLTEIWRNAKAFDAEQKCKHQGYEKDVLGYKASHIVDYCRNCGAMRSTWRDGKAGSQHFGNWRDTP